MIDPNEIASLYYFGDLPYWKLPKIAVDALEQGFDGPALRRLAGLLNPVESDMYSEEVDSAFREMGVAAPIPKDVARLNLAAKSAMKALSFHSNVFDEATHISIHLCESNNPPPELRRIVELSEEVSRPRRTGWVGETMSFLLRDSESLESQLREAMSEFLRSRE